jgi:inorganic pyrophosphatase
VTPVISIGNKEEQMNIWHDISDSRIKPEKFMAVIEIPKGGKQKYELDKATGMLRLDRILYTSTHYPANYGFIPRTLADDGDPLDVLVLCTENLQPMCLVECYPIGVFSMTDNDELDEKIIAIPFEEPQMNHWRDMQDLPPHVFSEIQHFFSVYKSLEHKETSMQEVECADTARQVVSKCLDAYRVHFRIHD